MSAMRTTQPYTSEHLSLITEYKEEREIIEQLLDDRQSDTRDKEMKKHAALRRTVYNKLRRNQKLNQSHPT